MSEQNKNILLGEAYGLRAYLHFDLFRLFGPAWKNKTNEPILPYNNKTQITMNHTDYDKTEYSTAEAYMDSLLVDINKAEKLLKENDPILNDANSITVKLENDFYKNRNRRMNYYALIGLKARVLQYIGDLNEAGKAAKIITDQVGAGKRFDWAYYPDKMDYMKKYQNYILFSEVIFGINNLDMVSHGKDWYAGSSLADSYLVDKNNLFKNIFDNTDDIRLRQWTLSDIMPSYGFSEEGVYRSVKYNVYVPETDGSGIPAIKELQPLMRISEMYYIQAEAALEPGGSGKDAAIALLNTVLDHRGVSPLSPSYLTSTSSEVDVQNHIEREYYREFIGEGQVFFFHKRRGDAYLFNGYGEGKNTIPYNTADYVVRIPDEEKNI
jgi:hypothetical protein